MAEKLSLRAFQLSEGPKSAKMLHLEMDGTLRDQFAVICRTLCLSALRVSDVSFHTTLNKRVDVRPLAVDKPIATLGLHHNDIFIVRVKRSSAARTPSVSPDGKPNPTTRSPPAPSTSSHSTSAYLETPSPSTPTHQAATDMPGRSSTDTSHHRGDRPQPSPPLSLPSHLEQPHSAHSQVLSGADAWPASRAELVVEDALEGSQEEQHVTALAEAAASGRQQAEVLQCKLHLCLAALCAAQHRLFSESPSRSLSAPDEQQIHEELLGLFIQRCPTLSRTGVTARRLLANASRPASVYSAVENTYALDCANGQPLPAAKVACLERLLSHCAPGLKPAARMICTLYEGRELKFLSTLLERVYGTVAVADGFTPLSKAIGGRSCLAVSPATDCHGWFDVLAAVRKHAALYRALLGDARAYARVLETCVEAACQVDELAAPHDWP